MEDSASLLPPRITFERAGRTHHLRIHSAADLRHALTLDEAHWVATSAPVSTMRCDATFLKLMDLDRNDRIRVFEMKAAIEWTLEHLADPAGLEAQSETLRLQAINADARDGARVLMSIRKMLNTLGMPDADAISIAQIRKIKGEVESWPVSGAGVVLPAAAEDEVVRQFLTDIVTITGGADHPTRQKGVTAELMAAFRGEVDAWQKWVDAGAPPADGAATELYPLGLSTTAAADAVDALEAKIEQYFAQCLAVAYRSDWRAIVPPSGGDAGQTDFSDPAAIRTLMRKGALAEPGAHRSLPLTETFNPAYAAEIAALRDIAVRPILGDDHDALSPEDWSAVKQKLATYRGWKASRPADRVATLAPERLSEAHDPALKQAVEALIAHSSETAFQLDNINVAEKLALYQRHLIDMANNFVSFPKLYRHDLRAIFEVGTLIMDGRRFNFAIKVHDRTEHANIAKSSNMFVLYLQLTDKAGETFEVAVPVTAGGKANLVVGKRGIFQDVDEKEWDARVVQLIENPVSLREAILAPFKRIAKLINDKIEAMTGVAEKELDAVTNQTLTDIESTKAAPQDVATAAATPAASAATAKPVAAAPASSAGMTGGLIAGGGAALAALSAAAAYVSKVVVDQPAVIVGVIGAAVFAVLGPTIVLAVVKLGRRDLSAILEGSGWAINARMRLTRSQSRFFTMRPRYPKGARGFFGWRWWLRLFVIGFVIATLISWGYLMSNDTRGKDKRGKRPAPAQVQDQVQTPTS